jgi:RNA polymerase sigma-70 factor (ECF subfamily)
MLVVTAAETRSKRLEALLRRIAEARDQAAFAELYDASRGKLLATALLIVRRRDLAEEVVQEAYVRIWLKANSYRPSAGSPMTWMIAIARNLAIDLVRRPAPEIDADDALLQSLPSDSLTAIEEIEASEGHRAAIEQQQRVLCALKTLDPERRDLVIAAYLHGESREQLSRRAGVSVNTVKTWLRRALLEVEARLRSASPDAAGAAMVAHAIPHREVPALPR